MRHVESFSHHFSPFWMQIQSILNISEEPSAALRKLCGITMKMFTCLTCFLSFFYVFFWLFWLHFWRALKYAAPKNIWHYVFANLITLPLLDYLTQRRESERGRERGILTTSLPFPLEATPCSLSVWSLLACKLHWLPRCTFLSFLLNLSISPSPPSYSLSHQPRFATLFFAYSFDLLAFCLALCARHFFFAFSTYLTQCKSFLFSHSLYLSFVLCLAVYCLPACLYSFSNTWRIYVPSLNRGEGERGR